MRSEKYLISAVLICLLFCTFRLSSATVTTVGSGNWNSTVVNAPWPLGIVPATTDYVIINTNNTVNITASQSIAGVTLSTNGVVNFNTNNCTLTVNGGFVMSNNSVISGNGTTRMLLVTGNMDVSGPNKTIQNVAIQVNGTLNNSSGNLTLNTANTASKYFGNFVNAGTFVNNSNNVPFTVGGDFTNNGTFTSGTGRVTFTGAASNTISGSAALTTFGGGITVNKGNSQNNILEVTSVITMNNGGLTITNGTFKLSSASTFTPFTADPNIPVNARLWNNGGTMNSSASIDWTLLGKIQINAGSINFGTAINDRIAPNSSGATSGEIEIVSGTLSVTGRISSGANPWRYIMSGGTCSLGTLGNNTAGRDVFNLDNSTNGVFSMSGGTLVICNKGGGAGENLGYHNTATLGSGFTGGWLQMGTASTATGSIMRVESSIPVYNLLVNAPSSTVQIQTPAAPTVTFLQISNDITIQDGTLDISFLDTEVGGDWTNASAVSDPLIEGTRKVTFDGNIAQSVSNSGSANSMIFYNIEINNSFGTIPQITFSNNITATNGFTLTSGNVNLNSTTLTLGTSAAAPGTLLRTSGFLYGGTFSRWFPTALFAIGNVSGLFPMGTSVGDYRPLWVAYSANLTTGGIINVVHSPTYPATYVAASHVDASWGNTLQGVSNSLWTVSTSTLAFNGATGIIRFGGTGFGTNALTDLDASLLASVIGTHGAATNVNTTYEVNRTALTTANIANAWRIGTRNVTASPLPIVLRQFAAEPADDHVGLNWETASELNSDHFTLERSSDGRAFVFVQKVSASGNSSSIRRYAIEDHEALEGLNYYRLKLFDKDGSEQSFPLVFADMRSTPLNEVQLFPNPSTGYVDVKGWTAGSTDQLVVMDESGRLAKASAYTGRLELSELPSGVYTVKLISGAQTRVQKLVISK